MTESADHTVVERAVVEPEAAERKAPVSQASVLNEPDDLPVTEVYGTADNIARLGSPVDHAHHLQDTQLRYYFYPTWRSQTILLVTYAMLCVLSIVGSRYLTVLVIKGRLLSIGAADLYLHLPLLALVPAFVLSKILINVYDAKYIIDEMGVEAQVGLVSLSLRQPRLRYEDIRGVEPNQTIVERLLGIGSLLIGSAMTQDVEIVMEGIANPRAVQRLINGERERRLRLLQGSGSGAAKAVLLTGD